MGDKPVKIMLDGMTEEPIAIPFPFEIGGYIIRNPNEWQGLKRIYEELRAFADERRELLKDAFFWVNSHETTRIIHKVQFEKFKSELRGHLSEFWDMAFRKEFENFKEADFDIDPGEITNDQIANGEWRKFVRNEQKSLADRRLAWIRTMNDRRISMGLSCICCNLRPQPRYMDGYIDRHTSNCELAKEIK